MHTSWLYVLQMEVTADQSFTLWKQGFSTFCSSDLDLDLMTFIYEFDSYSLEIVSKFYYFKSHNITA